MADQARQRDPLIELVERQLEKGADAQAVVAEVLRELADQLPEHFGPEARATYRGHLRHRAQLIENGTPWVRPFLAGSWQWQ